MTLFDVFIIGIGLSMDAFAVSLCKGLAQKNAGIRGMVIAGLWFGVFQAMMPVIGYLLGLTVSSLIDRYSGIIACILLTLIGTGMIREAIKNGSEENDKPDSKESYDGFSPKAMFPAAVATSIDALTVGVTFSTYKVNILKAALLIGITTFVISAAGVKAGSIFGNKYEKKAQIAGGIILIIMGLRFLLIK